jgi:uncharacterized membrane protein YhhN
VQCHYDGGMQHPNVATVSDRLLKWAFAPFVVISITHVILLWMGHSAAYPTKLMLMPALMIPVLLFAERMRPAVIPVLLVLAIFCSWIGDGANAFFGWLSDDSLPVMLAFFGLAHVFYIVLFWRHMPERRWPWWSLIFIAWWVGMLAFLYPALGAMFIPVALYGLVLGGTAALATRCHPIIALGAAFFLISDTVLAFRLFRRELMPDWTSPLVMITYTLGQGLIIAGVIIAMRRRDARAAAATGS